MERSRDRSRSREPSNLKMGWSGSPSGSSGKAKDGLKVPGAAGTPAIGSSLDPAESGTPVIIGAGTITPPDEVNPGGAGGRKTA